MLNNGAFNVIDCEKKKKTVFSHNSSNHLITRLALMLYDDESTRFLIHTPRFVVSTRWVATHMNALTTNPSVYIWIDKTLRGFFSVVLRYFERLFSDHVTFIICAELLKRIILRRKSREKSFLALWKNKLTAVLFIDFKAGNSYLTFFVSKIKYIVNQPKPIEIHRKFIYDPFCGLFL